MIRTGLKETEKRKMCAMQGSQCSLKGHSAFRENFSRYTQLDKCVGA